MIIMIKIQGYLQFFILLYSITCPYHTLLPLSTVHQRSPDHTHLFQDHTHPCIHRVLGHQTFLVLAQMLGHIIDKSYELTRERTHTVCPLEILDLDPSVLFSHPISFHQCTSCNPKHLDDYNIPQSKIRKAFC